MKLVPNTKRYAEFKTGDVVYFNGVRMTVYRPSWYQLERSDIRVAVVSPAGKVSAIHLEDLEVEVEEEPEPPAKEYRETNYYSDLSTGTLYYISGADAIAVNVMSASIATGTIKANPARYKRLYKEV